MQGAGENTFAGAAFPQQEQGGGGGGSLRGGFEHLLDERFLRREIRQGSPVESIDSSSTTRFSSRWLFSIRVKDWRICSGVNGLAM